jgi:hypothetical protein
MHVLVKSGCIWHSLLLYQTVWWFCPKCFCNNALFWVHSFVVAGDAFLVQENFSRLPLKMDAPEKVLCQAHGQARPVTDFLHENGNHLIYHMLLPWVLVIQILPIIAPSSVPLSPHAQTCTLMETWINLGFFTSSWVVFFLQCWIL